MSREEFNIVEYIIYANGEKYELGRIKSLQDDGAFVHIMKARQDPKLRMILCTN